MLNLYIFSRVVHQRKWLGPKIRFLPQLCQKMYDFYKTKSLFILMTFVMAWLYYKSILGIFFFLSGVPTKSNNKAWAMFAHYILQNTDWCELQNLGA